VLGIGKADSPQAGDPVRLGGRALAAAKAMRVAAATVLPARPDGPLEPDATAACAPGLRPRAYACDRYKAKTPAADPGPEALKIAVGTPDAARARRAFAPQAAVADGVDLARDLVNEPANVLGPVELAAAAEALAADGVGVEVLTEKEMRRLGMRALLGVA